MCIHTHLNHSCVHIIFCTLFLSLSAIRLRFVMNEGGWVDHFNAYAYAAITFCSHSPFILSNNCNEFG